MLVIGNDYECCYVSGSFRENFISMTGNQLLQVFATEFVAGITCMVKRGYDLSCKTGVIAC